MKWAMKAERKFSTNAREERKGHGIRMRAANFAAVAHGGIHKQGGIRKTIILTQDQLF